MANQATSRIRHGSENNRRESQKCTINNKRSKRSLYGSCFCHILGRAVRGESLRRNKDVVFREAIIISMPWLVGAWFIGFAYVHISNEIEVAQLRDRVNSPYLMSLADLKHIQDIRISDL